jgi:hypothetical protein
MADSMLIIALLAAGVAAAMYDTALTRARELVDANKKIAELETKLDRLEREAARNADMFRAIQTSEEMLGELRKNLPEDNAEWGKDQSLRFGDDLIRFNSGDSTVIWQPNGRDLMRKFCTALAPLLEKPFASTGGNEASAQTSKRSDVFTILIEGHTDAQRCGGDDTCNWFLSGQRAAEVRAQMLRPDVCPGGDKWTLIPIAMAASRPLTEDTSPAGLRQNRRIELKIVPNYEKLISPTRLPPPKAEALADATTVRPQPTSPLQVGKFTLTSVELIQPEVLRTFDEAELQLMVNEIYARHGEIFAAGTPRAVYFKKEPWYRPTVKDASSLLSTLEWANIETIRKEIAQRKRPPEGSSAPPAPP